MHRSSWCRRGSRGLALPFVLCLVFLIAASFLIVHLIAQFNVKHLDRTDAYLRSIYIAEAGFARVLARLEARPFQDRWFKDSPYVESDVPYSGGSYSYLIADTPDGDQEFDLWIRGEYDGSQAILFWRVSAYRTALSLFASYHVLHFTYDDGVDLPADPSRSPLLRKVQEILTKRSRNRPAADALEREILRDPNLKQAVSLGGIPGLDDVLVRVPLEAGGPHQPLGPESDVTAVQLDSGPPIPRPQVDVVLGQIPEPTATPPGTTGGMIPADQPGVFWPASSSNPWSQSGGESWDWVGGVSTIFGALSPGGRSRGNGGRFR